MDKILFFDGYCSLCNTLVDTMVRWDKNKVLKYASLQGETAIKYLPSEKISGLDPDTVLYLRDGQIYDRSTAILLSLNDMGGAWKLTAVFYIVPKFIRDMVYRFIAAIRYKVFGKRDTCRLPTLKERATFLP